MGEGTGGVGGVCGVWAWVVMGAGSVCGRGVAGLSHTLTLAGRLQPLRVWARQFLNLSVHVRAPMLPHPPTHPHLSQHDAPDDFPRDPSCAHRGWRRRRWPGQTYVVLRLCTSSRCTHARPHPSLNLPR